MLKQNFGKIFGYPGLVFLSIGLVTTACNPAPQVETQTESTVASPSEVSTSDLPKVVAASTVLCDLAEQIAQETVDLTCLLQPGVDPHTYSPTPSDRQAIEDADLVLFVGHNYEPGLTKIIQSSSASIPKVAVVEVAVPDPIMGKGDDHAGHSEAGTDHAEQGHTEAGAAHEEHDQAEAGPDQDHDQGAESVQSATEELAPDPHVWHSPQQGIRLAEVINNQLQQVAATNAELYNQNTEAIKAELAALDTWIAEQVATVPEASRKLITPHDSFRYFAQEYGFEVGGTISGLNTEARPSAKRMAELVELVESAEVPAIFAEQTTNNQWIEAVARDAKVEVAEQALFVEGPGTPDSAAPNYQTMLITNTCTIVNALGGQCEPTSAPTTALSKEF
jgi:manganese/iron transport system substrate-binding protein